MNDQNTVLSVRNVGISIPLDEGLLTPVRGVSFELRERETLALVGESGCGKSLTCKAILGINEKRCRTDGEILFTDREGRTNDLLRLKPGGAQIRDIRGKRISMIFQEPMSAFSPLFTVGHQMAECLKIHENATARDARAQCVDMMKKVGIANPEKRFDQYPHEFSGGMLQRALIAMALLCDPRLLIADEPTTALDVTIQAQILELLRQLQKDQGMSILYITHDLGTVAQMCDRVAVMYLGRIVETGAVSEVFRHPLHPYTRGLLGSVHKIGGGRERLFSIEGSVPLAMNLDDRCGFYDRCTHCENGCEGCEPTLREAAPDHFVACYHPYEGGDGQ
ncbi:MAG: ABC transporter ATP-binding protein [Eubacteriales bacterium]|nr:ABC transporter ATP-binding protein [Eubacteriales bacterium]